MVDAYGRITGASSVSLFAIHDQRVLHVSVPAVALGLTTTVVPTFTALADANFTVAITTVAGAGVSVVPSYRVTAKTTISVSIAVMAVTAAITTGTVTLDVTLTD